MFSLLHTRRKISIDKFLSAKGKEGRKEHSIGKNTLIPHHYSHIILELLFTTFDVLFCVMNSLNFSRANPKFLSKTNFRLNVSRIRKQTCQCDKIDSAVWVSDERRMGREESDRALCVHYFNTFNDSGRFSQLESSRVGGVCFA